MIVTANLEDKYTFKFKEKQKVAVESILHGPMDIIYTNTCLAPAILRAIDA